MNSIKNNKFFSYLIILLSLFILFLFTFKQYEILQENLDIKNNLEAEKLEKKELVEQNEQIKSKLESDETLTKQFLKKVSEDEIISYIFNYAEDSIESGNPIEITNISLTKGIKNDLGFYESDIDISANVSNVETMKRFLDFFINSSEYYFIIDNFNYPNNGNEGSFNINIPLKIYYY